MGVTLQLRLIDHRHVVELGLPAVNRALAANDASLLVDYLCAIPFTPDEKHIALCRARRDKLREVNAPEVFIENEERFLRIASGEAYQREALMAKSLDELREILGMWCFVQNSFVVGKACLPQSCKVGDPQASALEWAFGGAAQSPLDDVGMPVIRTCGSKADDCFGYNPPEVIGIIRPALQAQTAKQTDQARQAFAVVQTVYQTAAERNFGVACEYSL